MPSVLDLLLMLCADMVTSVLHSPDLNDPDVLHFFAQLMFVNTQVLQNYKELQ